MDGINMYYKVSKINDTTFKIQNGDRTLYFNDCENQITSEPIESVYNKKDNHPIPELRIIPTNACQLDCRYCSTHHERELDFEKKPVSFDCVKQWIDYYADHFDCFTISFVGGGEPTINRILIENVLTYTSSLNSRVNHSIITNGIIPHSFLEFLINKGVRVVISMDGDYETVSNQQSGIYNYDTHEGIINNIAYLLKKNADFSVNSVFLAETLTRQNNAMVNTCEYFLSIGVKKLSISVDNSIWSKPMELSLRQSIKNNAINLVCWVPAHKKSISVGCELLVSRTNYLDCRECQSVFKEGQSITITPNGKISYCYNDQIAAIPQQDSIVETGKTIYSMNSRLREEIRQFRKKNCDGCIARQICYVTRCPACFKHSQFPLFCYNLQNFRMDMLDYYFQQYRGRVFS